MKEPGMTMVRNECDSMTLRVVAAALVGGTLDLIYALGVNAAYGVPPLRVLQYIASGLLGAAAFQGGGLTSLVGLASHYALMAIFAAVLALAVRRTDLRRLHPLLLGFGAGTALFIVMNLIIVPLSQTPAIPPLPLGRLGLEILVHSLLVGPIVAWMIAGWAVGSRRRVASVGE